MASLLEAWSCIHGVPYISVLPNHESRLTLGVSQGHDAGAVSGVSSSAFKAPGLTR